MTDASLPLVGALPVPDPDRGRIEALRRSPPGAARGAAAAELQVMFVAQLLAAMRRTVPESGLLPRSPMRATYEGLFDRSVAEAMAARDPLGIVARLGGEPAIKTPGHRADSGSENHGTGEP